MMASPAPAKSQPLHNFPLPSLWSKSQHRARRHHTASPPPERRRNPPPQWESRRISVSIPRPSDPTPQKRPHPTTPSAPSDRKISIKIRGTHPPKRDEAEAENDEREERKRKAENDERKAEADDELAKTWNLRPRKQKTKRKNVGPLPENKTVSEATAAEGGDKREMKSEKFSLSLSKTEIEDDLFAMTGSRPTRRPKKRPRTVQKQLDDIFPGMWLGSITPDSYKVNEATEKP